MPAEAASPPPRPRSPAQIAAARENGARSRGPVTAEGKARACRNALRHGLYSAQALAPGEDGEAFDALLARLRAEHAPRDTTEHLLVERLALVFWKLARCDRLEARLATIEPHCPPGRLFADPGLPRLLSRVPELATLLRHQAQLERQLHRLLRLLADRRRVPVEPPAEEAPASEPEVPLDPDRKICRNEPEPEAPAQARPDPAVVSRDPAIADPAATPSAPSGARPVSGADRHPEPPASASVTPGPLFCHPPVEPEDPSGWPAQGGP